MLELQLIKATTLTERYGISKVHLDAREAIQNEAEKESQTLRLNDQVAEALHDLGCVCQVESSHTCNIVR